MVDVADSDAVVLLTLLHEPNVSKATLLKALNLDDIEDEAICNVGEDRVADAIAFGEATVEMESRLAQLLVLLAKKGIRRTRGGQPSNRRQKMRKSTVMARARQIKAELTIGGMDATQAHLEAADVAADEGKRHGIDLLPGYVHREMQKSIVPTANRNSASVPPAFQKPIDPNHEGSCEPAGS